MHDDGIAMTRSSATATASSVT